MIHLRAILLSGSAFGIDELCRRAGGGLPGLRAGRNAQGSKVGEGNGRRQRINGHEKRERCENNTNQVVDRLIHRPRFDVRLP